MLITQEQLEPIKHSDMNNVHDEEIELIEKLHAVAKNSDIKAITELLNELIEHMEEHFSFEEALMQENNYSGFHEHKHEHAKELMDIRSIRSFFEMTNDASAIAAYMHDSFSPWIMEHVENWDSDLSEFLQK
jgi:hemerythrin